MTYLAIAQLGQVNEGELRCNHLLQSRHQWATQALIRRSGLGFKRLKLSDDVDRSDRQAQECECVNCEC